MASTQRRRMNLTRGIGLPKQAIAIRVPRGFFQESGVAHQFVKDLKPGQYIEDEVYLVQSKDLRTTSQGSLYIHAVLADRTGQVLARHWQATEAGFQTMGQSRFMRFKGRAENYKGNLQFIIDGMRPADEGSYEITDFLPTTERNIDEMWSRLVEILEGIKHPHLRALTQEFLADQALMADFRRSPAAVVLHHAYIGGLLEHTLNLLELGLKVIPQYPRLSLDLVLTGLFLHDIGKARELVHETMIGYSDCGQLVGHITLATIWIHEKAQQISAKSKSPFPPDLLSVLQHIVLSHHGRYEFGSPKLPALPEAVAIHHLDNLDAKINMFITEIDRDKSSENWTNYHRALETKLFKPNVTESHDQ